MPLYIANRRISHNSVIYGPDESAGNLLELSAEDAAPHLENGTLSEASASVPSAPTAPTDAEPTEPELTIPHLEEEPVAVELETEADFRTNLNTATEAELKSLKWIGAATAKKLIAARPFATLDEAKSAANLTVEQWAELEPALKV